MSADETTTPERPPERRLPTPAADGAAVRVLLVEAVEATDPEGRLLTRAERAQASRDARVLGAGDPLGFVVARADALAERLVARVPGLGTALRVARFPLGVVPAVLLGAVVLGLAGNALGPERRINVLSLPLLGVLAWNVAVYATLVAAALRRSPRAGAVGTPLRGAWAHALAWTWKARPRHVDAETAAVAARALAAYSRAWRRALAPLWMARVRALLHLASAALAAGLLVGMYVRGLALEYRATWESTFLGPGEVHALLALLLGPAGALLGRPLPGPAELEAIRAPLAGPAAPWIHLYAVTAGLVVVAPRLVLAGLAARRARRLAATLPVDLDAPYYRRLLAAERGEATRVEVVPYSYHLEPRRAEPLAAALRDAAGHRADLRFRDPADYGAEAPDLLPSGGGSGVGAPEPGAVWIVLVFTLAQPPEPEVHGELLHQLREWVAGGPGTRRLLVVVDGSEYRERLARTGAEVLRLADRRRAWDRIAGQAGVPCAHVDLGAGGDGALDTTADIEPGLWPRLGVGP